MKKVLVCLLLAICLFSTATYGFAVSTVEEEATPSVTMTVDDDMTVVENNIKERVVAVSAVTLLAGSFILGYSRKKSANESVN